MDTFVLNKILNTDSNSYLIAGIDIDEDGKLDLFWQKKDPATGIMKLHFIYTNVHLDHYYLKSCMINQDAKDRFNVKYGYGVIGSSARYIATDTNDQKFVNSGS